MSTKQDEQRYDVVINQEEQYSIWPTSREIPAGWSAIGTQGSKDECLAHIETIWTDMRPRSIRLATDGELRSDS